MFWVYLPTDERNDTDFDNKESPASSKAEKNAFPRELHTPPNTTQRPVH